MSAPLTWGKAEEVFQALAAKGDEIAFRHLAEGCECRARLMIEHLQAVGIDPGRGWVLAVGRLLTFPNPGRPRQLIKWNNHVAPTVAVGGAEQGVLVIDPSTQTGPVPLTGWGRSLGAVAVEVSSRGLA